MTSFEPAPDEDRPEAGDRVVLTAGLFTGHAGHIESYDRASDVYLIHLDNGHHVFAFPGIFEVIASEMPDTPAHGMTSEQLADYVSDFIVACTTRVRGVGDEQYSEGTHQKFEAMGVDELFDWAMEEVQDLAVYAAMLHIRLDRVKQAIKGQI